MNFTTQSSILTDAAILTLLRAATDAAAAMNQPQCITIVDASGVMLATFRMQGSRFLSLKIALAKARTAASFGMPTHRLSEQIRLPIAAATQGAITGLRGGLPIRMAGVLVGGIGISSGSGEQDEEVARAALAAIEAEIEP